MRAKSCARTRETLIKTLLCITLSVLSLHFTEAKAEAGFSITIGTGGGYDYWGAPMYSPGQIVWVPGHWEYGYWVPGHYVRFYQYPVAPGYYYQPSYQSFGFYFGTGGSRHWRHR